MTDDQLKRATGVLERIGMVLGAMYAAQLGDEASLGQKAKRLQGCGFSNTDIADLLGSTANSIGVALHNLRRRGSHKRKRK